MAVKGTRQVVAAAPSEPDDAPAVEDDAPIEDEPIQVLMIRILRALPAIGKNRDNTEQHFKFRGIEDVMNALHPLMARHCVLSSPTVLERIADRRTTRGGGALYEVNLHVEYTFTGPRGDSMKADAWGEGVDNFDKATNKAMTGAYKNVLNQVFTIATKELGETDQDRTGGEETIDDRAARAAEAAEAARAAAEAEKWEALAVEKGWASKAEHDGYMAWIKGEGPKLGQPFKDWWAAEEIGLWPITAAAARKIDAWIADHATPADGATPTPEGEGTPANAVAHGPAEGDPPHPPTSPGEYAPDDPERPFTDGEDSQ